jgi:hypothetical protein
MQLNIIDVGQPNTHAAANGRSYQSLEVTYKNDTGQVQGKKLMSFSNPAVFKAAQDWQKGDVVNVVSEKDAKGYWQWTRVLGEGEEAPVSSAPAPKPQQATRVTGSNYETKEERAERQVLIVRQSSLSSAVATLAIAGSKATANDVISLAKLYEGYVFGNNQQAQEPEPFTELDDEVPIL